MRSFLGLLFPLAIFMPFTATASSLAAPSDEQETDPAVLTMLKWFQDLKWAFEVEQ